MGDKNQSVNVDNTGDQEATVINNVKEIDYWMLGLLILFAGWAIPSPREMIRGTANLFRKK